MLKKLSMHFMFLFPNACRRRSYMLIANSVLTKLSSSFLEAFHEVSLWWEERLLQYSYELPQSPKGMPTRKYTSKEKQLNQLQPLTQLQEENWVILISEQPFGITHTSPARVMVLKVYRNLLIVLFNQRYRYTVSQTHTEHLVQPSGSPA